MQFEIGKTYETTVRNFYPACGLVDVGQQFTCHCVDGDGHAWVKDVKYYGKLPSYDMGWCVATQLELQDGKVRAVG